jgi:hypothetical protein
MVFALEIAAAAVGMFGIGLGFGAFLYWVEELTGSADRTAVRRPAPASPHARLFPLSPRPFLQHRLSESRPRRPRRLLSRVQ